MKLTIRQRINGRVIWLGAYIAIAVTVIVLLLATGVRIG